MSTPENPESGQLTRRQMREKGATASTPVVGGDTAVATQEPPAPRAPLARPARPVPIPPAPVPDAAVDLGVSPLTRRQARQQERIRTASVPVITPEIAASHTAPPMPPSAVAPEPAPVLWTPAVADERESDEALAADAEAPVTAEVVVDEPAAVSPAEVDERPAIDEPTAMDEPAATADEAQVDEGQADEGQADEGQADGGQVDAVPQESDGERHGSTDAEPAADEPWADPSDPAAEPEAAPEPPRVDDRLGEHLLRSPDPADDDDLSFDELITRDSGSSGSVSTPHALILDHVPSASPLSAVTSTGEVIVTGIYNLPDGLGSQGHAHGAADGKEIDATLIDGELPASSSPTPIAASSAISTVRGSSEIIRPPAPEKANRWVMGLMITAGALALALVGLLVYVVASGVFA